jgi:transcriptional regulator GlxA family with amidase domain
MPYLPHVRAERLDKYLEERATDPTLKMRDLCHRFGVSRSHISRLFREHLHTSFEERRAYHRVQMAKRLLKFTDDPLKTIAPQCGFRNEQRLSETFHRVEGMSPGQYRESLWT